MDVSGPSRTATCSVRPLEHGQLPQRPAGGIDSPVLEAKRGELVVANTITGMPLGHVGTLDVRSKGGRSRIGARLPNEAVT